MCICICMFVILFVTLKHFLGLKSKEPIHNQFISLETKDGIEQTDICVRFSAMCLCVHVCALCII